MTNDIHEEILIAFPRSHLPMSWSSSSSACSATANISLRVFASTFVSFITLVMMSGGKFAGSDNHSGSRHQSLDVWFTSLPRLPRSSGFFSVPRCLHSMYSSSWILRTWLPRNCLYSPLPGFPIEGHSAIQPTIRVPYRKPLQSFLDVMDKVCGHVPGNQLQAVTRSWLVPEYCCTTAKTATETPFPMASPKA